MERLGTWEVPQVYDGLHVHFEGSPLAIPGTVMRLLHIQVRYVFLVGSRVWRDRTAAADKLQGDIQGILLEGKNLGWIQDSDGFDQVDPSTVCATGVRADWKCLQVGATDLQ